METEKKARLLLIICIFGCFLAGLLFVFWVKIAQKHQVAAFSGDAYSAKRIILPFYKPLIRVYAVLFFIISGILCFAFLDPGPIHRFYEYYGFALLVLYSIVPCLLLQTSASLKALWRTFYQITPWWAITTIFWGLSFLKNTTGLAFHYLFIFTAISFPIVIAVGILTKCIYSRVQLGSLSNRNTTDLLLIFAILYGILTFASVTAIGIDFDVDILLVIIYFFTNVFYPFAMYRTLIADTKFWRGLGKHNQGGIKLETELRESGIDVHRPTMELNIISDSFQSMMADNNDITVDFAFLQLERLIGEGATAKVFRGKLKGKLVAVKLSTPPEITEEVLDIFVAEARIASTLRHRNIVQFLGICVRPPQVSFL